MNTGHCPVYSRACVRARRREPAPRMTSFPPFRADHVGSLLRPPQLLKAGADHQGGRISAEELRRPRLRDEEVRSQGGNGFESVVAGPTHASKPERRRRGYALVTLEVPPEATTEGLAALGWAPFAEQADSRAIEIRVTPATGPEERLSSVCHLRRSRS